MSALLQVLHFTSPLSRKGLPTLRGLAILGARELMSLETRSNCFLVMMAENAFSTLTGAALSLAFVPQTKVPV